MAAFDSSTSLFTSIENLLNRWLLKLFPVWYLTQAAQTLSLAPIGRLNPASFLAHRWLSLRSVNQALIASLEQEEDAQWRTLAKQLQQLIVEKELTRSFSIMTINGVEQSEHSDDWPSLIAYANELHPEGFAEADDFDTNLLAAFPDAERPHRIVYREWDGRAYWLNKNEPTLLAQLQLYGHVKQRDGQVYAKVNIESLNPTVLDKIRHHWWLLVFHKESIQEFSNMARQAGLPFVLANFEWRRDDLAVLIAPKNSRKLNRILLNLIHKRSTQEVIELGSYISRKHHPLTKKDN